MKRIVLVAFVLVCLVATVLTLGVASHAAGAQDTVVRDETVFYKYNAIDGELAGGARSDDGKTVGWLGGGGNGTVTITVTSDKAGLATIYVAYASEQTRSMAVTVNDTTKEFGSLKTGSWSNFTEMSFTAELKEGNNTVVIGGVGTGDAPNVDYILVSEVIELSDDPDAAIPNDSLDSTLSPGDRDYVFYAQTRANRQNAEKKDVRIICVAKQSWLNEIPNFVATFTFTDGTTPKELNSVGLKNVFKSITAYGTNGNVETYTAAEGAVIFGWIITEVPEAYADIVKNTPKATVVTDAEAEPDVKPGVDYETLVTEKTDINVCQDGILYKASNDGDKVGSMQSGNGGKATYILTGNYDGVYQLTVSYIDCEGRWLHISVNGTVYSQKMTAPFSTDWNNTKDTENVKKITLTVEMKKGVNVITFSAIKDWAPNLVDFDLTRIGDVTDPVKTIVASANPVGYSVSFEGKGKVDGTRFGYMDGVGDKTQITVDGLSAGKYLAKVYYCSQDNGRAIELSVNGAEASFHRVYKTGSWDNLNTAVVCSIPVTLKEGKNTLTFSGHDGVNSVPIWKIELVPVQ